jgi:hypothetical protein
MKTVNETSPKVAKRSIMKKSSTKSYQVEIDGNAVKVSTACKTFGLPILLTEGEARGQINSDPKAGGMSKCKKCQPEVQAACLAKHGPLPEVQAAGVRSKIGKDVEVKAYMLSLVKKGNYSRKEIVDSTLRKFPEYAKSTIGTAISDSCNVKYSRKTGLGDL